MLEVLDASAVRRWCAAGLEALRRHQREIDDLNVYPVPDGDTGTNLVLTLASAQQALAVDGASGAAETLRLMARGALLGARGNSGVIVSQILRGLADALAGAAVVDGRALGGALGRASSAAYAAVAEPVEGTILSVVAAGADAAAGAGDRLPDVVRAAARAAAEALARTPQQLAVLARAGVVDAGGRGLVVLLDALESVVTGTTPDRAHFPGKCALVGLSGSTFPENVGPAYEVQYLLDASEEAVARLRAALQPLGDSLVIVGTGDPDDSGVPTWNVHVHVDDVGAAIEAGVEAGRPHRITVTHFADANGRHSADAGPAPNVVDPNARAAVVVAPGPGLAELFRSEGAAVVGSTPSTAEVLAAVRSTGAGHVVVLPNDPNSQAVAATAATEAAADHVAVRVIPTRCAVQALAALAVRDPARQFEDDVIAMAEAAGACRYAEVTVASREALTVAGRCSPGDILALVDGEVNLIGKELATTCRDLLDRLLSAGGELVTLITGADCPEELPDSLSAHLAASFPFVEVQVYSGGQPHYPLLVGVE